MSDQNKNYIKKINLNYEDDESIAEFISYERQAAIHDLINENSFSINEDDIGGPYVIEIEISDNVLIVKITNDNQSYSKDHRIPINSLKKTVKIYHSACNLYFDSIKIQNKKEPIRYKILESSVYETEDEYFGKTKIYKDYLKIVFNDNYDESDHAIFYQGCAEQGFCYPIQKYIL